MRSKALEIIAEMKETVQEIERLTMNYNYNGARWELILTLPNRLDELEEVLEVARDYEEKK